MPNDVSYKTISLSDIYYIIKEDKYPAGFCSRMIALDNNWDKVAYKHGAMDKARKRGWIKTIQIRRGMANDIYCYYK